MTQAFHEAGLHIEEESFVAKRATEKAKKREEPLLARAEELECQNKVDNVPTASESFFQCEWMKQRSS